ncbi:oxysterol-binding protein [Cordyceps javanica]|uniref:Oxysterol-binding protein n=1 Tax=Cordyceps javanica TaxID=43265 RepID=A0A545V8N4_9HYPO|nr:oxysterol-binding protein [Cordyceps javanica]TQW08738.1 oxysterol-binding protein [Cordyceps javanica]
MAGIERLEVHSKSYIVRWVRADAGSTLSWSVQPHKKSIYFGIFRHPGSGATSLVSSSADDGPLTPELDEGKANKSNKKDTAQEILASKGFIPVKWVGKCEADKVSIGTYDVIDGQGGMYGLVFDNTFSKQTSKTATFVVLTYPTGAPPQGTTTIPNLQVPKSRDSQSSLPKTGTFSQDAEPRGSTDSLHSPDVTGRARSASNRTDGNAASYHVGTLSKRRRKKGQGYARRFFSLDYSTYTLSYYYNRNSSALRGAIPLSLAAIAADERRREISIDSGAEVWHLRAPNAKEFQDWARALEKASRAARGLENETSQTSAKTNVPRTRTVSGRQQAPGQAEEAEWHEVETLVSRVVGTRDALRRLTKEVAALPKPGASPSALSPNAAAVGEDGESYFPAAERKSFWRRKSSAPGMSPAVFTPASGSTPVIDTNGSKAAKRRSKSAVQEEKNLQGHCESLLADLDSVVAQFSSLISTSKRRRMSSAPPEPVTSRLSMESTASTVDEFFDAEDAGSRVLKINETDEESAAESEEEEDDGSSVSSMEDEDAIGPDGANHLYPIKSKTLTPLPVTTKVNRRQTIPPATVLPPSLIAFVRKNVGKDLSTISMPVSANEPLSLLQKLSEQLEYAELLDKAAKLTAPAERLIYVTAFAISQFSSGRAKERAIRKPFNPLLGETFELVRGDTETPGGFRLLVEKVQHRPVKLAIHAESAQWSLAQSAAPGQKFWGKSAEITTDGRVRVALHLADGKDELYSWNIANMFLRNVVMGEKYVEPVGTMTVTNDSTGHKASIEFRSKGMFGGRSEDVHVEILNPDGSDAGTGMAGTWTTGLHKSGKGKHSAGSGDAVWHVGGLVDNAAQTYGLTRFAATLNEITDIERDKMAPTDSRLRPDQRMAEEGALDEAEGWKQKLEEEQRVRRRQLEDSGEAYAPRWFVKVSDDAPDGEECWRIKTGKDSYWEERAKGAWTGVTDIFKV